MARWVKWGVLTLGVSGLLVLAGRFVVSQQPIPMPPPPNYAVLFEKARPYLEQAIGGKLDFTPQFRHVTAVQLAGAPEPNLDAHIRWHFPHLQGETLSRTRQFSRQIVSSAAVAHYVEGSGVIAVANENLARIATWEKSLASVNSEAFLQLALVREVVLWDLDRRFGLAALRSRCCDGEEWDALHAIIEGRAQLVTRQVAEKLGSTALVPLLVSRYLHVPDSAADPSLRAVSQTALHARNRACTQGENFFTLLNDKGVAKPDQLVFANLPRQMTMVTRPDLWLKAREKNQPDLVTVLRSVESTLPAMDWLPAQQTWTPTMLVQITNMLGAPEERAEKVGGTWHEGRSLVWTHRVSPDRQVALSVVRHDSYYGARAYFGFAVDLQRKHDTLPPGTCGPTIRVVESKSSSLRLEGFDESVRNEKLIAFGEAPPMPVTLLLARAGDLVVECTWHGAGADSTIAERLVHSVRIAAVAHPVQMTPK